MHLAFFCLNLLLVYYLNSYFIPTGHIDYHSCSQQSDKVYSHGTKYKYSQLTKYI